MLPFGEHIFIANYFLEPLLYIEALFHLSPCLHWINNLVLKP